MIIKNSIMTSITITFEERRFTKNEENFAECKKCCIKMELSKDNNGFQKLVY